MKKVIGRVCTALFFLTAWTQLFAQEERPIHDELDFFPKSLLELKYPVKNVGWSKANSFFVLTEKDCLQLKYKADRYDTNLAEQTIIQSQSAHITAIKSEASEFLILMTDDNLISVRNFPYDKDFVYGKAPLEDKILCHGFNLTTQYLALGLESGEVKLWTIPNNSLITGTEPLVFYTMNENYVLKGHTGPVYAVAFSPDSEYFASAGDDRQIFIRKISSTNEVAYVMDGPKKGRFPILFTNDSRKIISAANDKEITIRAFNDIVEQVFKTKYAIKNYQLSLDGDTLYVQCENNGIYLFSITEGVEIGWIPPFRLESINDFAFSGDESKLLVGHENGTVFLLAVDDVILKPGAKGPSLNKGVIAGANSGNGKFRPPHSLEIRTDISRVADPYTFGVTPSLGYSNGELLKPFYFGGMVKAFVAFPDSVDFPYHYSYRLGYSNGRVQAADLPSPLIEGLQVAIPIGFAIKPFKNDLEFFAEASAAFSLYSFYFKKTEKTPGGFEFFFPSFTGEIIAGASWQMITVYAGASYDLKLGFAFKAGAGYRIKVGG